jgi:hypothetical protein
MASLACSLVVVPSMLSFEELPLVCYDFGLIFVWCPACSKYDEVSECSGNNVEKASF